MMIHCNYYVEVTKCWSWLTGILNSHEEGICQLLFFEGDPCDTTYSDREGKYQYQPEKVTLAKV